MDHATEHFVNVDGRKVYYRRKGDGPVIVFLHGSPQSSRAVTDLVDAVGDGFTCISMDTPGNGLSDPLPIDAPDAADYADALLQFIDALNLRRVAIYGFHTGAGTGMEFLRRHPGRATCLVADGYSIWTEAERADFLANYLPPFEILPNGAHLAALWSRMEEQMVFFPWYDRTEKARMVYDVPPPMHIHANTMDVLNAGDAFRAPYAAAFKRGGEDGLHEITDAQVLFACFAGDPLAAHLARLPAGLPDNFSIDTEIADRDAVLASFRNLLQDNPADPAPPPPQTQADGSGLVHGVTSSSAGGLHWTGRLDRPDRPLVLLHDAAGSKRFFNRSLPSLVEGRAAVAIDLPGYGDGLGLDAPDTVEGFADIIESALNDLGLDEVDACGYQLGAQISAELAARGRAKTAGIIGAPVWDETERQDLLDHYTEPSLAPEWEGGHLMRAWKIALWSGLFYPWYRRDAGHALPAAISVAPIDLHNRTIDLLKAGDTYKSGFKAQHTYDLAAAVSRARSVKGFAAPFDALSTPERFAKLGLRDPAPLSADVSDWGQTLAAI